MVRGMSTSYDWRSPDAPRTLTPALLGVMWLVLCGFATFFISYATLVIHGQRMGLTTATAGAVLTIMMIAVVAVQPAVPAINARCGARATFGLALGLLALGNAITTFTQFPLTALLTGSVILGTGFGVLVVVGTAVVPGTVPAQRLGRALGFFGATTASATALGAPLGLWLSTVVSTAQFRWLSVAVVALAVPALAALPARTQTRYPSEPSAELPQTDSSPVRLVGLLVVLVPAALILTVFGLVLAFGPPADGLNPAWYIVSMQVFVIIGRFVASASLDRYPPVVIMMLGLVIALAGLVATALSSGVALLAVMAVLGIGTGAVQAASLLLAFQQAGSSTRGSVAWNMTFDIGLGFAGLVGGLGFTYLGADLTYLLCAAVLFVVSAVFFWYFRATSRS